MTPTSRKLRQAGTRSIAVLGFCGAIVALICLVGQTSAQDSKDAKDGKEAKDGKVQSVKVQDPKRGSIPELVYAYGTATPTSGATVTASFQRDGQVADIFVEVGDQFKKGDPLLDFGASPQAVIAYEMAKTDLTLKQRTLERKQQLFKLKLATYDDVEGAEKDVSDAQSTIEMYEKIGSIKPSEILAAPFDGVVTAISVSKGDRISAGSALMTLSRTDQIILSVGVVPGQIDRVKTDLPVHVTPLLPGRKPFDAKVKRIGAAIDTHTRQIPVLIELPGANALGGENFKAGIEVGKFQGWVVPSDSISSDTKGKYVWQIDNDKAKRVNVNVIGAVGKNSVVEGEINSQQSMILSGKYQIDEGMHVQPAEEEQSEDDDDDD